MGTVSKLTVGLAAVVQAAERYIETEMRNG